MKHHIKVYFLGVFLSLQISANAQNSTCSDNFEADSLQTAWQFVDFTGDDDAAVKVENGELHIQARGQDVYNDRNFFAGVVRNDILGDFDVSVKIVSQDSINPWAQTGIMAVNDINDLSQGGYSFISVSPTNGARFFYDVSGVVGETNTNVTGVGFVELPLWIRLEKKEGKMNSWFKTDSSGEWQKIESDAVPQELAENSHIALYTFSHEKEITGLVKMDDFACLHGEFPLTNLVKPEAGPFNLNSKKGAWFNILGRKSHQSPIYSPRAIVKP